jgi:hypothetical protein
MQAARRETDEAIAENLARGDGDGATPSDGPGPHALPAQPEVVDSPVARR